MTLPDVERYVSLADAAYRLRVAQAVVAELTATPVDPTVLALACEELEHAQHSYRTLCAH